MFFRSDALTRQLSAPLVDERRQYLAQCLAQGMSKCTLRMKARLLLSIAEYLRLAERPNDTISLPEIKKAASRWSSHNWRSPESSHAKRSREHQNCVIADGDWRCRPGMYGAVLLVIPGNGEAGRVEGLPLVKQKINCDGYGQLEQANGSGWSRRQRTWLGSWLRRRRGLSASCRSGTSGA